MSALTKLPRCCGHDMRIKMDLGKFLEVQCQHCKDTVYIKKNEVPKPQLLDD